MTLAICVSALIGCGADGTPENTAGSTDCSDPDLVDARSPYATISGDGKLIRVLDNDTASIERCRIVLTREESGLRVSVLVTDPPAVTLDALGACVKGAIPGTAAGLPIDRRDLAPSKSFRDWTCSDVPVELVSE